MDRSNDVLMAAGIEAPIPEVRSTADVVFSRKKMAIFVDGCFWHGCPDHGTWPKANSEWWKAKLERNVARDRETGRILTEAGWHVFRIWEHEDVVEACDRIEKWIEAEL